MSSMLDAGHGAGARILETGAGGRTGAEPGGSPGGSRRRALGRRVDGAAGDPPQRPVRPHQHAAGTRLHPPGRSAGPLPPRHRRVGPAPRPNGDAARAGRCVPPRDGDEPVRGVAGAVLARSGRRGDRRACPRQPGGAGRLPERRAPEPRHGGRHRARRRPSRRRSRRRPAPPGAPGRRIRHHQRRRRRDLLPGVCRRGAPGGGDPGGHSRLPSGDDQVAALTATMRETAARLSYRMGAAVYQPYGWAAGDPVEPSRDLTDAELKEFLSGLWGAQLACVRQDGTPARGAALVRVGWRRLLAGRLTGRLLAGVRGRTGTGFVDLRRALATAATRPSSTGSPKRWTRRTYPAGWPASGAGSPCATWGRAPTSRPG